MIDKLINKIFGFLDKIWNKVENIMTFDFSHCEKHDCPKKKNKLNKNNKYFKS